MIILLMAAEAANSRSEAQAFTGTINQPQNANCNGPNLSGTFDFNPVRTNYSYWVRFKAGGADQLLSNVLAANGRINKGDQVYVQVNNVGSWSASLTASDTPAPQVIPCATTCDCDCDCASCSSDCACFPAGTKITLADNTKKQIEEICSGDIVATYDINSGEIKTSAVSDVIQPVREGVWKIICEDGKELRTTREHPVYVKKSDNYQGWAAIDPKATAESHMKMKDVRKIEVGDALLNESLEWTIVKALEYEEGEIQLYNLKEVEKYNNFFAGSFLVHNKDGDCSGGCSGGCEGGGCEGGSCGCGSGGACGMGCNE